MREVVEAYKKLLFVLKICKKEAKSLTFVESSRDSAKKI